jgi:hypothetical protein
MSANYFTWAGVIALLAIGALVVCVLAVVWVGRAIERRLDRVIDLLENEREK